MNKCKYDKMRWPYPRKPKLDRKLSSNYKEGEVEFDRRVKAHFPKGTNESELISQLQNEGFAVDQSKLDFNNAFITQGLIFRTLWSVRWRTKEGQVDEIWGVYGVTAP